MKSITKWAVLGLTLLLSVPAARAQYRGKPIRPTPRIVVQSAIAASSSSSATYVAPTYASTLHGMADLTRATGTYHLLVQQAAQERERVRQLRLQTRAKELAHSRWKKNYLREMRQEEIAQNAQDAREHAIQRAEVTEIVGGRALNVILHELKKSPAARSYSESVKQEWLDGVNFVSTNGHAGLLKEKNLIWPAVIQEDRFSRARRRIEGLLEEARQDVKMGRLSARTVKDLLVQHKQLDEEVTEEVTGKGSIWTPGHHIRANRFLKELKQTIELLQNPKEARFLSHHRPRCKTVAELVSHMRQNGLTFGPTSAGSERHYLSLHNALANEARSAAP